jgi:hypothetical protein
LGRTQPQNTTKLQFTEHFRDYSLRFVKKYFDFVIKLQSFSISIS